MSKPRRIQLSRKKGWRKPDNCVVVARPTRWGNPFKVGDQIKAPEGQPVAVCFSAEQAVDAYARLLQTRNMAAFRADVRRELGGKDLACWCPLDQPCHADVLLEIANAGEGK